MRSTAVAMTLVTITLVMATLFAIAPLTPPPAGHAQGIATTPPVILEGAISALNAAIPGRGRPSSWLYTIALDINTVGLGCPTASTDPLGRSVTVYQITLTYADAEYLYYVAEDGSVIVPCDADLLGSTSNGGPVGGPVASGVVITEANFAQLSTIYTITPARADDVAYSPDGLYFAIAGEGVQLYTYPDYRLLLDLGQYLGTGDLYPSAMAFSADGRFLVLGYASGTLLTYEMATGLFMPVAVTFGHIVNVIEFDANNRMAVGTGGFDARERPPQLAVFNFNGFDAETGVLPVLMQQFIESVGVYDVAFVGDTAVAGRGIGDLHVFDIATGTELLNADAPRFGRPVVISSADEREQPILLTVAGSDDTSTSGQLMRWELGQSTLTAVSSLGTDLVNDMLNVTTASGLNFQVIAYETATGGNVVAAIPFLAFGSLPLNAVNVTFSPDGRHLAVVVRGDVANTVDVWAVR